MPVIRIGDVDKNKTDKFWNGQYDKKYIVSHNDILLGLSGSFKANKWQGEKALLNQRVATLRDFENKTAESFVFYQLPKLLKDLEKLITQLSVKNILTKHLDSLKILYPSLETQKQIVERLDKIVEAQKLQGGLIQKADELYASIAIQEIQKKKWAKHRLKDVVENIEYGFSTPIASKIDGDGVPILTMAEIAKDGSIEYSRLRKITVSTKELERFKLKRGDVLFNWRNASADLIGKTALFDKDIEAVFASFLLRVIPRQKVLDRNFLFFVLNCLRATGFFKERAKYSANNTVNASELKQLRIPLPPLKTQKQIVAKLSAIQDYKTQLLAQKMKLKELFDSVLHKSMQNDSVLPH